MAVRYIPVDGNPETERKNKTIRRVKFADYICAFGLSILVFPSSSLLEATEQFQRGEMPNLPFVYIVEGEFDVLALLAKAFQVRQSPDLVNTYKVIGTGGTSGFKPKLIQSLQKVGCIPILIPDADRAGKKTVENLIKKAEEDKNPLDLNKVWTANLEEWGVKDMDELCRKYDFQEVKAILQQLNLTSLEDLKRRIKEERLKKEIEILSFLPKPYRRAYMESKNLILLETWQEEKVNISAIFEPNFEYQKTEWNGFYPGGCVSLLLGTEGSGKTYFALWQAMDIILRSEKEKKVFMWLSEDPPAVIQTRLYQLYQYYYSTLDEEDKKRIASNLYIICNSPIPLILPNGKDFVPNPNGVSFLSRTLEEYDIVFLDPLTYFYQQDENLTHIAQKFMLILVGLVKDSDKSIVLLHHLNKTAQHVRDRGSNPSSWMLRGSCAFSAHSRHVLMVWKPKMKGEKDDGSREIWIVKSNMARTGKLTEKLPAGNGTLFALPYSFSARKEKEKYEDTDTF